MVNREAGMKTTRRRFVQGLGAIAPVSMLDARLLAAAEAIPRDYFEELGLKPFVNAIGPYSSLGGAEMWPEVIQAMDYAATHKARMSELHDAVGRRIAELTGADAAMVTAGATCAMMLGVAACMAGDDQEKIERLPNTEGMPSEIIMLSPQRYLYDRSLRAPGATLTFVDTAAEVRAAIGPQTATTPPTIRDAARNISFFTRPVFTPRLIARSSPIMKRFISRCRKASRITPVPRNGSRFVRSL
jgi:L-seryl-tRNA(Ser) seleniumtransferase